MDLATPPSPGAAPDLNQAQVVTEQVPVEAGETATDLNQQPISFQPDSTGFQPDSTSFQPDNTGFQPDSSGFQPDGTGFQPDSTGFQPDNTGFQSDSTGYPTDSPGPEGYPTEGYQHSYDPNTATMDSNLSKTGEKSG